MVFGLVDCNNFFVSCERVFQPALNQAPVLVLSNNDGCVISRSNEAKKLGIKMAQPYYQVKQLCNREGVTVFSCNFQLYGDISKRIMTHLQDYSPEVEIYSIDEAFLGFKGTQDYTQLGRTIRSNILQQQHVPISIGFAPTKTLAKLAAEIAKSSTRANGVLDLTNPRHQQIALQRTPVEGIWGIGYRLAKRLHRKNIMTAWQLVNADEVWLKKTFSVMLLRTVAELRGIPCIDMELARPAKQSIMTSRSFATATNDMDELKEMVAGYAARAGEKLREEGMEASTLMTFVKTNKHRHDEPQHMGMVYVELPEATSNTGNLISAAHQALKEAWQPGYAYQKAGVMVVNLSPIKAHQGNLFGSVTVNDHLPLHAAINRLNHRYGDGSVRYLAEGLRPRFRLKKANRSPLYTTQWDELPIVT